MPRYAAIPEKKLRVSLPSTPGAEVWGPGELDFWEETRIRSRSQRNEVNPMTGQGVTIVDSALFEYELFHSWLEHPEAGWNLFNEQDQPYDRTREIIDRIFKGDGGKKDRNTVLLRLVQTFFPEMLPEGSAVASEEQDRVAEGNAQPAPSNGEVPHEPTPMTSLVSDERTGSTPSPTVMPSPPQPLSVIPNY